MQWEIFRFGEEMRRLCPGNVCQKVRHLIRPPHVETRRASGWTNLCFWKSLRIFCPMHFGMPRIRQRFLWIMKKKAGCSSSMSMMTDRALLKEN